MPNTSDTFDECSSFYSTQQKYPISKKQEFLIEAVVDWITSKLSETLDPLYHETQLLLFREAIRNFLKSRFEKLGCANLRTIGSMCNLYLIADKFQIPHEALPENVSIIINSTACYYLKGAFPQRHIIKTY